MDESREAFLTLKEYRRRLTRQQVRTLAGQIKSGHPNEAMNGLAKILDRSERRDERNMAKKDSCRLSRRGDISTVF